MAKAGVDRGGIEIGRPGGERDGGRIAGDGIDGPEVDQVADRRLDGERPRHPGHLDHRSGIAPDRDRLAAAHGPGSEVVQGREPHRRQPDPHRRPSRGGAEQEPALRRHEHDLHLVGGERLEGDDVDILLGVEADGADLAAPGDPQRRRKHEVAGNTDHHPIDRARFAPRHRDRRSQVELDPVGAEPRDPGGGLVAVDEVPSGVRRQAAERGGRGRRERLRLVQHGEQRIARNRGNRGVELGGAAAGDVEASPQRWLRVGLAPRDGVRQLSTEHVGRQRAVGRRRRGGTTRR